ncbi:Hypothetical_protein [Hexamita inflata]|uniref:Hypothetical_protein n=1 Tax=Hexamita inflata TaxID=28002 RepID=A0AA86QUU8_9EUKA|nr:Hypothetical protein HINF_LOCUS45670 [Hexamita inflata]
MVEVDFENFVNYLRSGNTDKLNIISFQQNQQHKINLSTQLIFDRILTKTVVQLYQLQSLCDKITLNCCVNNRFKPQCLDEPQYELNHIKLSLTADNLQTVQEEYRIELVITLRKLYMMRLWVTFNCIECNTIISCVRRKVNIRRINEFQTSTYLKKQQNV